MTPKQGPASRWRPASIPREGSEEKLTAGVPLAKVIKRELIQGPEVVMLAQKRSLAAERFRRLRTTLETEAGATPKVIVVTSPGPNEGKSLIALNLALALAAEKRGEVLLIDADLRRPTIQQHLSPPPNLGFSDVLEGRTEIDHTILSLTNSSLEVLPAGEPPREPAELLGSETAKETLETLRRRYHRVIIDTPPIVPFADADIVGGASDGFLLVARSGQTERAAYLRAFSMMTSARVLGAVLNDASFSLADWNLRYDKYYNQYYNRKGEE